MHSKHGKSRHCGISDTGAGRSKSQREQEKCDLFGTNRSALTEATAVRCSLDVMKRMTPMQVNLPSETSVSKRSVNSLFDPWFTPTGHTEITAVITVPFFAQCKKTQL